MSSSPPSKEPVVFDTYAANYEDTLASGLAISGEDQEYFAHKRVEWLGECLHRLSCVPGAILDFGCGTGAASPFLLAMTGATSLVGVDLSTESLKVARQTYEAAHLHFQHLDDYHPQQRIDLAFCNGVFHHIPPTGYAGSIDYIYRALRPGGLFAFWENNPWNPGARYVMSRIPFDRDALMLSAAKARGLLHAGGFEIVRADFLFLFPRALRWLRMLEPFVSRLPLGAQYQILCRKP
jgi:SAM-dependent methyltransferase